MEDFFTNKKILFIVVILCISMVNIKCAKEGFNLQNPQTHVLSQNAEDFSQRLAAIKKEFYDLKLDEKFKPKIKQDVVWTPDWQHPRSQVINDTVSYVFYAMKGYYEKGKVKGNVNTYGAKFYLVVKNEHEFYKGVYFSEIKEGDDEKKEVILKNFTGKLLLTNLQTQQAFLLKYSDGKILDNLTRDQKIASAKKMSTKGKTSYWQTQCHQEMRYCVYTSDGYSSCGGAIDIIVSYYCQWPSPHCGTSYYMIDNAEESVCEDYWYPDPPQPTEPNTSGNTGDTEDSPVNQDIIDSLKGYPCAQALIKEMKTNICTDIAALIKSTFAKDDLVNIKFKPVDSLKGTTTDGHEVKENFSVYNGDFTIGLNPDVLNHATQEYILATMYHEALHAFFDRQRQILTATEFQRKYEGVNVSGGRLLGVPNDSHLPMAYQNYVKGLKNVIMKFNTSFNEDRAWIIAKHGVIQLLPDEVKLNNKERNTTNGGYIGTKCP